MAHRTWSATEAPEDAYEEWFRALIAGDGRTAADRMTPALQEQAVRRYEEVHGPIPDRVPDAFGRAFACETACEAMQPVFSGVMAPDAPIEFIDTTPTPDGVRLTVRVRTRGLGWASPATVELSPAGSRWLLCGEAEAVPTATLADGGA